MAAANDDKVSAEDLQDQLARCKISTEDQNRAKESIQKGGIKEFANFLNDENDAWKEIKVNIGLIGRSGVGKSTLINMLMDMEPEQKGAAAVGVTQMTKKKTQYPLPTNPNLVFWDVPGVNTPQFARDDYWEAIGANSFDFFLIVSADRFTEDDAWLAKKILEKDMQFFFVRTKIDQDLRDAEDDYPSTFNTDNILGQIRDEIDANLEQLKCCFQFFLTARPRRVKQPDGHRKNNWSDCVDFLPLREQLVGEFPRMKQEALILSLNAISTKEIERKAKQLESRLWRSAALSALVNAVRIPGIGLAVDSSRLKNDLEFYYTQLGLDDDSIRRKAEQYGVDEKLLKEIAESVYPKAALAGTSISRGIVQIGTWAADAAVFTLLGASVIALPILGAILVAEAGVAAASFAAVYYTSKKSLSKMKNAALQVSKALIKANIQPRHAIRKI